VQEPSPKLKTSALLAGLWFICGVMPLAGCGTLPASGPGQIKGGVAAKPAVPATQEADPEYVVVNISKQIADYLSQVEKKPPPGVDAWPGDTKMKNVRISVNDTVEVSIYESQSGGLFIPAEAGVRPGNFVSLPPQMIDSTGLINIPFAGTVSVLGKTPVEVAAEVTEKLGDRAIEPQAVVSIVNRQGAEVSVIGAVSDAGRFPLSLNGDRILDAIARAGGPAFPGFETWVTLQRGKKEWSVPFETLVQNPGMNVHLIPGDTVYLYREPESFQIFGASGSNGFFPFNQPRITLSEAMGFARGLVDSRADPSEIYLYRLESEESLDGMGLDFDPSKAAFKNPDAVPVIYRLDLRDPQGFFFAQNFGVRNKDVIYIANSKSTEFIKFLDLVGITSATKITSQTAVEQ
jgi:polysaccharide export outer membrane protein